MLFIAGKQEAHQNVGVWHQTMEILFSNQSSLCLDVNFQQNYRHKKNFFCSQMLFYRHMLFLQAMLFIEKIANNENLSSYISQGDGGLKKNNPYHIKLKRE
jgi:hypothetical protein